VQRVFGGQIARITGNDPAGPFFSLGVSNDRKLSKEDAEFVDIYHTNRRALGSPEHRTGDINVYINGGDDQPGCRQADGGGAITGI